MQDPRPHDTDMSRFEDAIARFDARNAKDPNQDEGQPKELLYAQRMTEAMTRFAPDASEALRLAARAQHIERWRIPRSDYEMNRVGYLRWRKELKAMHARVASDELRAAGYDETIIQTVATLLEKKGLKTNPEVQCLEDVVCLVFLEHYWADFMAKHDDDKLVDIVRKTWAKMSEAGHQAALTLPFDERSKRIVQRALGD